MRTDILNTIIDRQQKLVQNLQKSLETYNTTTDLDEQDTIDLDAQSHQADIQDMSIEMAQKLKMEQDDLALIKSLRLRESSKIQEGAVVETKDLILFIGFTFAPIQWNDKKILGVSLEAPVYNANVNKEKGDTIKLGDKEEEILNIY